MTSSHPLTIVPPWTYDGGRRPPKRINVAVRPETVRALELIIEREGVSLTEAVRRLVGYGEFVYRTVKEDGKELLVRDSISIFDVTLT